MKYRTIREKAGLTRQEMALFLGLNKVSGKARVAAIECGSREPSGPIQRLYHLIDTLTKEDKDLMLYLLKSIDNLDKTA